MQPQDPQDILMEINNRTRLLENKYSLMRDRVFMVNQNMIEEYKKLSQEMKGINKDLKEIKNDVFKIRDTLKQVINEMEFFARKENLKVLEKYINMWNPLSYVTQEELTQQLLELKKRKHKKLMKHKKR